MLTRRHFAKKMVKITPKIKRWIKQLIWENLSPEQVANYLRRHKGISLHHETIYRLIYKDKMDGGIYGNISRLPENPTANAMASRNPPQITDKMTTIFKICAVA